MDDNRHGVVSVGAVVLLYKIQAESDWELEVELDSGALMLTSESCQRKRVKRDYLLVAIEHVDINLGAVEGTISSLYLPVSGSRKIVQGLRERLFGLVPDSDFTQILESSE